MSKLESRFRTWRPKKSVEEIKDSIKNTEELLARLRDDHTTPSTATVTFEYPSGTWGGWTSGSTKGAWTSTAATTTFTVPPGWVYGSSLPREATDEEAQAIVDQVIADYLAEKIAPTPF